MRRTRCYAKGQLLLLGLWLGAWLGASPWGTPAYGQFAQVWAARTVAEGANLNLFLTWEGTVAADGFEVDLPAGSRLRRAALLRRGYAPLPVDVQREETVENRYRIAGMKAGAGRCELVLQVSLGDALLPASWSVTPFRLGPGRGAAPVRLEGDGAVGRWLPALPGPEPDNQVLAFSPGDGPPLLLRSAALPPLDLQAQFTVAFWMRTVGLDEVVLSTWDGDEDGAYAADFMVGRNGCLLVYRGRPGHHQALMTRTPVADGQWHHVALSHDGPRGWTRLRVDGAPADSLYDAALPAIEQGGGVAVGGRVPGPAGRDGVRPFSGALDELRFWNRALPASQLRQTMDAPLGAASRLSSDAASGTERRQDHVGFGFEDEVPAAYVERAATRTQRVRSALGLRQPVRLLRADVEGAVVRLAWEAPGGFAEAFLIERSTDGIAFEVVGRQAAAGVGAGVGAAGGAGVYTFADPAPPGQVLFYRVRQRFVGGGEGLSSTLKVGRAEAPPASHEAAVGLMLHNFPNPFREGTTIAYEVPDRQPVRLSVWDLSGQPVALLVDAVQAAGRYEVPFEAGDLSSGTYFIRLETSNGTRSAKMMLTK